MKLAIQGHPTRGKEVIQILESLGGKNKEELKGTYDTFYYIDDKNEIGDDHKKNFPPTYKLYTLEEFEKEFPFKIGNIVTLRGINKPHKIIALELYVNKLCYKLDNGLHFSPHALTTYEKMKQERNITLTLKKAKEWYKKGGELREIALQAFAEKELTEVELPESWEEFCNNYSMKNGECYIGACSEIHILTELDKGRDVEMDKNVCTSQKSAEAHLAMIQLEQLRNCWWNGWEPIWDISQKYCIYLSHNEVQVRMCTNVARFLTFPNREMALKFLECFRDLIELARNLI